MKEIMKKRLDKLEDFLIEIKSDKAIIFNFEKVSNFERELFLSIQSVLNEKYNYHLDGLTNIHLRKFKENINKRNVQLDKNTEKLANLAFNMYTMVSKRNIDLGYGATDSKKTINTAKFEEFIQTIEVYIKTYESILGQ